MTYRKALEEAFRRLQAAGVPEPEIDAWYLLAQAAELSRARYYQIQGEEMPVALRETYVLLANRRAERIPLQHIAGTADFMGFSFRVGPQVLVPRFDTETLVEAVLDFGKKEGRELSLLDMCTGSGCIAVSLMKLGDFQPVTAVDLSPEALALARENAELNDCRIRFLEGDLFQPVTGERFDVLVSNPPYIPTGEIAGLMPEVRDHDPWIALDGKEDGLYFYRRLAQEGKSYLQAGGRVFYEIGYDQGPAVTAILNKEGYQNIRVIPDMAGNARVVTGECHV